MEAPERSFLNGTKDHTGTQGTPEKILALLQDAGINDVEGVQDLFKEMVNTVLEKGWKANWTRNSANLL